MREDARLAFPVDRLPPELSAALDGGEAGAIYAVHIRKLSAEDAAEFLEIRAKVREGLADLEAGKVLDEAEAFAEIQRIIDDRAE
ncbi:hypothetical protein IGS68_03800 [Skermanella sp. TT6]|uniref:Antitoxin ParD1/3/4 n=1 Tax=Skermanella cutis TaxID=2775420 RepID=A0ABX7BAR7_9PROT|nr:hypothetical protein [Skermanella sp. TT6]QQP90393.1 hypothetical protein IGS68_03800 [Skermanella sp. TT6]